MSDRVDTGTERVRRLAKLWRKTQPATGDLLESLAAERDTYRSAMQSALVLIDNGDAHKARSVLAQRGW